NGARVSDVLVDSLVSVHGRCPRSCLRTAEISAWRRASTRHERPSKPPSPARREARHDPCSASASSASETDMDSIGFIGLGQMGNPMAARLVDAGLRVLVYNRSPDKMRSLEERGALSKASARAAVPAPDGVVLSMVADDNALRAVSF